MNFIFIKQKPTTATMGLARINAKKRNKKERSEKREERKGIEAQRAKHPSPSRVTDALIGDEEENRK